MTFTGRTSVFSVADELYVHRAEYVPTWRGIFVVLPLYLHIFEFL